MSFSKANVFWSWQATFVFMQMFAWLSNYCRSCLHFPLKCHMNSLKLKVKICLQELFLFISLNVDKKICCFSTSCLWWKEYNWYQDFLDKQREIYLRFWHREIYIAFYAAMVQPHQKSKWPHTCPKDGMDSYVWRILSSLHWKDNLPLLLIKQEHIWNGRWFPVARQNFLILLITSIFTPTISWLTFWVLWPKGSVSFCYHFVFFHLPIIF